MKLALSILLAITALNGVYGEWTPLRGLSAQRHLDFGGNSFLVARLANENWCITATQGTSEFANLGFRPCDFDAAPSNQLWQLDAEGKIHSLLDFYKCMIIGFGTELFDMVRVRIANCNEDTDLNKFVHNGGTDQLKALVDENYCMTNRGTRPHTSDTIHMKPCRDEARYIWTYRADAVIQIFSQYGGAIELENAEISDGTALILGNGLDNRATWRFDTDGLFHTKLDDNLCMQAGQGQTAVDGNRLRVFSCDKNNENQKFDWNGTGPIKLQNNNVLCVTFLGEAANVTVDPIILSGCDAIGDRANWFAD